MDKRRMGKCHMDIEQPPPGQIVSGAQAWHALRDWLDSLLFCPELAGQPPFLP